MTKHEIILVDRSDYFTDIDFKDWMVKHFVQSVGVIPMDRSEGRVPQTALDKSLEVLKRGGLFGIHLGGIHPPDGRLYRGEIGIAQLALESGASIISVVMAGTNKSQPIGRRLPRPERVGVIAGKPLGFSRYIGTENDCFALRSITDEVMYTLTLLSGRGYVDEYATNVKKKSEETKKASKDAS